MRTQKGSDAYNLYEETGRCCPSRCISTWWLILAIGMQIIGLVMGIKLMSGECEKSGWFECVFKTRLDVPDWKFDFWK